jgi:hypothetical protein
MDQARPLFFGVVLLTLALPGHPLAPLSGLPFEVAAVCVLLLVIGWAIALPGAPPYTRPLTAALLGLAALKVALGWLAPEYGLDGSYRLDSKATAAFESAPRGSSVDGRLDFRGDAFPVHFVNDIRSLNFYTPTQPKRDLLPFAADWSGLLVVPNDGEQTLTLESNGAATLEIGSGPSATRVSVDRPGRVRDATLTATLPAGLTPIRVTYQRPDEAMPWLVVRNGPAGAEGPPVGGQQLVRSTTSAAAVARDRWLWPLALLADATLIALLVLGFVSHAWAAVWDAMRTSPPSHHAYYGALSPHGLSGAERESSSIFSPLPRTGPWRGGEAERLHGREEGSGVGASRSGWWPLGLAERVLLAAYVVIAVGSELLRHLHLFGRAVILSGGNDWLAYESFARDVLLNGPLLTEGRALGEGVPFYYQPLYIYWIALTHLLLGESLFAPLFMNTVLGVATGVGLYLLTRELFGRAAAIVALPLFEIYRLTVFAPTAGLLLSENLLFPLVPVVLLVLVRLSATGRLLTAAGAGLAMGLAGLARTTPLALVPPAMVLLVLAWRRVCLGRFCVGSDRLGLRWGAIAARLALIVVACTLTIGLATTRNYLVSGRPVPITSSAGANLWETHRPSSKVDLSRIDRDPLYERLGLDRATREVVEFVRQDPAGYVGTLVPMFLFAVGVVGAVDGRWDVQPLLFGLWLTYLTVTLLMRQARALTTWFLHVYIWTHLAQMTIFFSHQYGFRLILPMYVAMVPIAALGLTSVASWIGRQIAPAGPRSMAGAPLPPATRASLLVIALVGGAVGLGAGDWRGQEAAREAFYGLNGDAAIAARQAARLDLLRRADATYFVGDDSRSTDVAYLSGLAFPTLRWFDGARGLVLPPAGEQALYVMPDRAAADVAKRCLGDGASIGGERDPASGAGLELMIAADGADACAVPREPLGAPFSESVEPTSRLIGIEGPASIEPGRPMDMLIHWEALSRPRNRARPTVRLVDSRGRRWGQAESAVYPSSSWRPGERAMGIARLDVDPTLPPGDYHLAGGFSAGSGQARLAEDGPWGSAGLTLASGPAVRLVSRSTPVAPDSLVFDRRIDTVLDGARLLGVDLDRETARAGERLRVSLFWERTGAATGPREVSVIVRRGEGGALHEWRGVPVDGTYPTTSWKPGEIIRDTWDLVLPATLSSGELDLAVGLATAGEPAPRHASIGMVAVQAGDREVKEPELRARLDAFFVSGAELVGLDYKGRRVRAGETLDLTLVWRAARPISGDQLVTVALVDNVGRIHAQQENEPAGGKRPTSGWTADEYVEDGWKVRLPRDLPRGSVRLAVSLVDPIANQRVQTAAGTVWVDLPIDVGPE